MAGDVEGSSRIFCVWGGVQWVWKAVEGDNLSVVYISSFTDAGVQVWRYRCGTGAPVQVWYSCDMHK